MGLGLLYLPVKIKKLSSPLSMKVGLIGYVSTGALLSLCHGCHCG